MQRQATKTTHAHTPNSLGGKLELYSSLVKETTRQKTPVVERDAHETRPTGAWEAKATSTHNLGSAP